MAEPHKMIEASGAGFRRGRQPILADVTFSAEAGERIAILGASGAGKSTLLLLLAGLVAPSAGEIRIAGRAIKEPARDASLMLQRAALLPWATIEDNVLLGLRLSGAFARDEVGARRRAFDLLERVGLAGRASAKPFELSGGQQQRVALARALAPSPKVLLLDEPFSALDPETRASLRLDVLRMIEATATTLVLVTHDAADAALLCHRALELKGSPATIVGERTPASPAIAKMAHAA
jgi:NitT/TauT family transport system ATP-binding protein